MCAVTIENHYFISQLLFVNSTAPVLLYGRLAEWALQMGQTSHFEVVANKQTHSLEHRPS